MDQVVGQALAAFKRLRQRHDELAAAGAQSLPLSATVAHAGSSA
jgi:hypothetical protein